MSEQPSELESKAEQILARLADRLLSETPPDSDVLDGVRVFFGGFAQLRKNARDDGNHPADSFVARKRALMGEV